jgi:hypothetical protein
MDYFISTFENLPMVRTLSCSSASIHLLIP